jgi:hypothetical protein
MDTWAVYVPTGRSVIVVASWRETGCPLAANVPDIADIFSQAGGLAIVACQLNGQLQLPEAVITTL